MDAPVFVCGLSRSGTTWLSESLGQSDELVYVGEAWLIGKFKELVDWYSMIHDTWGRFATWKRHQIDRQAFIRSLSRFYEELLHLASGGNRFIEKTPEWNVKHLKLLHELFPDAFYILIYRDGRNYVASEEAKDRKQNKEVDFMKFCQTWAKAMDLFEEIQQKNAIQKYRLVRYEDLLRTFDKTFEELCTFVGIRPFTPKPFKPNSAFDNYQSPDDFNSRWESWSEEKRKAFKQYAGPQLLRWGYVESIDSW